MKFRKHYNEERSEAEGALRHTREEAAKRRHKNNEARSLFARIAEIRRRNHIAEAVREIMEGR